MEDSAEKLYKDLLTHGYSEAQAQRFLGRCKRVFGKMKEVEDGTVDNETVGD